MLVMENLAHTCLLGTKFAWLYLLIAPHLVRQYGSRGPNAGALIVILLLVGAMVAIHGVD